MTHAGWIVSFIVGVMVALMWWVLISASIAANAEPVIIHSINPSQQLAVSKNFKVPKGLHWARVSSPNIRRFESALQFAPGQMRVIPALGATIKYLHTEELPGSIYVVYIKKMD